MRNAGRFSVIIAASLAAAFATPSLAYQRPGRTERVSQAVTGAQRTHDSAPSDDAEISMSPGGRFVAFTSVTAESPVDTTGTGISLPAVSDVFLHDRSTGRTAIVSVASDGSAGKSIDPSCNGAHFPAVSANGRYVVFASCYDNFVPGSVPGTATGDTNLTVDVFVHDMKTGKTTRVSVASDGTQVGGGGAGNPTISADGRFVAFESQATNLAPGVCPNDPVQQAICEPTGPTLQVYIHDLHARTTRLVSVASGSAVAGDGSSYAASISPDGQFVAFTSDSDNLVTNDINRCANATPSCPDVYLHDIASGQTELISVGLDGQATAHRGGVLKGESGVVPVHQMISADDRYVAFRSNGENLVPNTGLFEYGVYVRDRKSKRTERFSVDSSGGAIDTGQNQFSLSADGRFVVTNDMNLECLGGVGLHDRLTGATETVDRVDYHGAKNACTDKYASHLPEVSENGRFVAFESSATNLVPGDTNGKTDVFVRDRGATIGVGGLVGAGRLSVSGAPSFRSNGFVGGADPSTDVDAELTAQGANLIGASLVYRPQYADLYVRLEVDQMPLFELANPALVYGLDFTVNGACYQLRAAKTGVTASFGLFRLDRDGWRHVADLHGGYGTTGQEVVFALPLADIGAQHGGQLHSVQAFTGLGGYLAGAINTPDQTTLAGAGRGR
jgi:Tol biopolymer transport system component